MSVIVGGGSMSVHRCAEYVLVADGQAKIELLRSGFGEQTGGMRLTFEDSALEYDSERAEHMGSARMIELSPEDVRAVKHLLMRD